MKKVTLNDNEKLVVEFLSECHTYDDRPTGMVEDLVDMGCPLTIHQIKGYFSSLERKGYIIECEVNGYDCMQLLGDDERLPPRIKVEEY